MTVAAVKALGTLLKRGDGGGPEVFTTVAEITNISGPSLGIDTIDVTSHESVGGWREFITGIADGGEITIDINYIPDNSAHDAVTGLLKDFEDQIAGTLTGGRNYQLVFPDTANTTWTFTAWITAFEPVADASGSEKLGASVTLKITGQPTLA